MPAGTRQSSQNRALHRKRVYKATTREILMDFRSLQLLLYFSFIHSEIRTPWKKSIWYVWIISPTSVRSSAFMWIRKVYFFNSSPTREFELEIGGDVQPCKFQGSTFYKDYRIVWNLGLFYWWYGPGLIGAELSGPFHELELGWLDY